MQQQRHAREPQLTPRNSRRRQLGSMQAAIGDGIIPYALHQTHLGASCKLKTCRNETRFQRGGYVERFCGGEVATAGLRSRFTAGSRLRRFVSGTAWPMRRSIIGSGDCATKRRVSCRSASSLLPRRSRSRGQKAGRCGCRVKKTAHTKLDRPLRCRRSALPLYAWPRRKNPVQSAASLPWYLDGLSRPNVLSIQNESADAQKCRSFRIRHLCSTAAGSLSSRLLRVGLYIAVAS